MEYQYMPLPPGRYIRLFQLHGMTASDLFQGSLHVVSLDSKPVYDAVSYEWGPPVISGKIFVDGKVILLRRNLQAFLFQLAQWQTSRLLWIDALCIHQASHDERGHQVRLMREIYSDASKVLVWLGFGDFKVRQIIEDLTERLPCDFVDQKRKGLFKYANMWEHLSSLTYWRRTWIIQEIVLAKQIIVLYDKVQIGWTRLAHVRIDQASTRLSELFRYRESYRKYTLNLRDLLYCSAESRCTDPRDKVYALLGLAHDYQKSPGFDVDYQKDTRDLLREVLNFCSTPKVQSLKFAHFVMTLLGIPSAQEHSDRCKSSTGFFYNQPDFTGFQLPPDTASNTQTIKVCDKQFFDCEGLIVGKVARAEIPELPRILRVLNSGRWFRGTSNPLEPLSPADLKVFKMLHEMVKRQPSKSGIEWILKDVPSEKLQLEILQLLQHQARDKSRIKLVEVQLQRDDVGYFPGDGEELQLRFFPSQAKEGDEIIAFDGFTRRGGHYSVPGASLTFALSLGSSDSGPTVLSPYRDRWLERIRLQKSFAKLYKWQDARDRGGVCIPEELRARIRQFTVSVSSGRLQRADIELVNFCNCLRVTDTRGHVGHLEEPREGEKVGLGTSPVMNLCETT
jgi:hypothetical protein